MAILQFDLVFIIHLQELVEDIPIQQGKVVRPMRIVNPDQEEYCGLIQVGDDGESLCYQLMKHQDIFDGSCVV